MMQSTEISLLGPRAAWRQFSSGCGGKGDSFSDFHNGLYGPDWCHVFSPHLLEWGQGESLIAGPTATTTFHALSPFCMSQPHLSRSAGETRGRHHGNSSIKVQSGKSGGSVSLRNHLQPGNPLTSALPPRGIQSLWVRMGPAVCASERQMCPVPAKSGLLYARRESGACTST